MTPEQREWYDKHRLAQYGFWPTCQNPRSLFHEKGWRGEIVRVRIRCWTCEPA